MSSATVDYTYTTSSIRFDSTTSSRTVTIPILEDDIVEYDETINVTLTRSSSRAVVSTPRATVIIIDNDGK